MMLKRSISFLMFCAIARMAAGQDSHFSQYDHSPLSVNPALTAVDKNLHVILHHRDQWKSMNAYRTDEMSLEFRFDPTNWRKVKGRTATYKKNKPKGFGLGVSLLSDRAGDANMKKFSCNFSLAYHAILDEKNRFSAGIIGGMKQRSINPYDLRWNSQYDITGAYDQNAPSGEIFNYNSVSYSDFSAGVCYSFGQDNMYMESNDNKAFRLGIAADHLSQPDNVYILDPTAKGYMRYTIHSNAMFGIKNSTSSIGYTLIAQQQGTQNETMVGFLFKHRMKDDSKYTGIKKGMAMTIGASYRIGDAVVPYFQFELARYALGVSYDVNMSGLTRATSGMGGLEITLRFFNPAPYLFEKKAKNKFN